MGTITITAAGFSALPVAAPTGWPANITWFGNGTIAPNGTRSATITDAEMLQLLTWCTASTVTPGTATNPATPTLSQILVTNWIGQWFNGTKTAIQQYFTQPAVVPSPINLT